jgi:hypothetical protein
VLRNIFDLNVTTPGQYTKRQCLHYLEPYYQLTCYEATVVDGTAVSCDIEVEGVTCNSCDIVHLAALRPVADLTARTRLLQSLHFGLTFVKRGKT